MTGTPLEGQCVFRTQSEARAWVPQAGVRECRAEQASLRGALRAVPVTSCMARRRAPEHLCHQSPLSGARPPAGDLPSVCPPWEHRPRLHQPATSPPRARVGTRVARCHWGLDGVGEVAPAAGPPSRARWPRPTALQRRRGRRCQWPARQGPSGSGSLVLPGLPPRGGTRSQRLRFLLGGQVRARRPGRRGQRAHHLDTCVRSPPSSVSAGGQRFLKERTFWKVKLCSVKCQTVKLTRVLCPTQPSGCRQDVPAAVGGAHGRQP